MLAVQSGYQNYHDQIIKKGDWSPALHTILFMWCIGYANDYRAHLRKFSATPIPASPLSFPPDAWHVRAKHQRGACCGRGS